jgi:hypothetical protein
MRNKLQKNTKSKQVKSWQRWHSLNPEASGGGGTTWIHEVTRQVALGNSVAPPATDHDERWRRLGFTAELGGDGGGGGQGSSGTLE